MSHRIKDKILLGIILTAAIVLLSESVTAVHVFISLLAVLVLASTEIINHRAIPFVFAVLTIAGAIYNPLALLIIPAVVYVLMSKGKLYESVTSAILLITAIAVPSTLTISAVSFLIAVIAGYMAYTTFHYEDKIHRSTSMFDEARQEAYDSARKRRELREKADSEIYTARLKERNRIAREIHDNVGHQITRVIVQMQALKIINKDPVVGSQLDSVSETLDLAMTGIRRSVHELHDDSIDLAIGINDIAKTLPDRFHTDVSTSIESPASNDIKTTILGIIKEACTNISKHSNGDKVRIEVIENATFWRILIHDNGKCPEREYSLSATAISDGHGIGLSNIYDRASSMGGRASIKSGASGFDVLATLPKNK